MDPKSFQLAHRLYRILHLEHPWIALRPLRYVVGPTRRYAGHLRILRPTRSFIWLYVRHDGRRPMKSEVPVEVILKKRDM